MSTVVSTVLIASPPAFLTGWLLSKALFRQVALRRMVTEAMRAKGLATPVTPAPTADQGVQAALNKALADQQQSQELASQLKEQLNAAQRRLQPLQGEVQLLKEAVAERDHLLLDLRRQLKLQNAPPEFPVGNAMTADAATDRPTAIEQSVAHQQSEIDLLNSRLGMARRRAQKWRIKSRELLRQFRQQRTMIGELREDLRKHQLQQQVQQPADAYRALQPAAQPPAGAISITGTGADYSAVNQENLQVLRGLGPALHRKLNERGIYRLGQLAELSPEESYQLCRSLGIGHKTAERNDWSERARELLGMAACSHADISVANDLN